MRLIDADVAEDTLKKCVSNTYKRRDIQCATGVSMAILQLRNIPTAYSIDEVVENLKERTDFLKNCTKYGNKNAEQQEKSYSTMMMYEVAELVDDLIEIVKAGRCF